MGISVWNSNWLIYTALLLVAVVVAIVVAVVIVIAVLVVAVFSICVALSLTGLFRGAVQW